MNLPFPATATRLQKSGRQTTGRHASCCPHDCPSACALEIEVLDNNTIGRVYGSQEQTYTAGVICAKVARYAERIHHPDRLLHPLRRTGPKGSGQWQRISWDEALDLTVNAMQEAGRQFGSESVWPYYYAGTMGLVMRDGINRLRHEMRYSGFYSTICTALAWPGYLAGTGRLAGPDPREMALSDCVVIWGTNAVATQVNVMTHAIRARKERGAKIVVIDIYHNATMQQADLALCLRPGTDGALACAVMHILFRDNLADRAYLQQFSDCPDELEAHLQSRTPEWASAITGLDVAEIEAFAQLVGHTKRSYFRLGYGFSRQRNGSASMHAASCIATVLGAWQHEGGGAFHNNGAIFHWNKQMIEGLDLVDPTIRRLDQSQIGRVLTHDPVALQGGPPVKMLLNQNTNPVSVAPEQTLVKQGFARDDLFTVVHEQFMTDTAQMADLVLPATMFMEHDDVYSGGGHQHITLGPKLIDAPGECWSNHQLITALASRLGAKHKGFSMSPRELIDQTLQASGWGTLAGIETKKFIDCQPDFATAHYRDGFAWPDKKFRFKPDWATVPFANNGPMGPFDSLPVLPDYWDINEAATGDYPFKLATSPARQYLNSSFTETKTSRTKEVRPTVLIHPSDAERLGIEDGCEVELSNARGAVRLHAKLFRGVLPGVLIAESIWPNSAYPDGNGINTLTGADQAAPFGGAAFHDIHAAIRPYLNTSD
jgi:anaerobic selenocysteine-containing dehydrogenase